MSVTGMGNTRGRQLSRDEVFELLSSPRRRGVLAYLQRTDGAAELSAMAARIAAWERNTGIEELTPDDRKRVYTSLQQTHLGKLEDAGAIEYDREANQVRSAEAADQLAVYLEIVPGGAFPWREYYLALGAIGTALALLAGVDLGVFAALPDALVGLLLAVALVVSAAAHIVQERHTGYLLPESPPED